MSMSRRKKSRQQSFWVATDHLLSSPGHPFYAKLNELLAGDGFDELVEAECAPFYSESGGRPSIPPGVYFRMLMIGYFERIDSERGICWRCGDSLSLRSFLGLALDERTPDHSSLSRIRNRLPLEVHLEVFQRILQLLVKEGLVRGKTLGVDATTLEANAAMRSIVRRDTGQAYDEFLVDLAKASGIETPTREDLARVDRKRPRKGSNDDWYNPNDPDAEITRMKDGRTHLAHKLEHGVDLDSGAVVAITLHGGATGDTTSLTDTVDEAIENLETADERVDDSLLHEGLTEEIVADKGYHSNGCLKNLQAMGYRTYISEPNRGKRRWKGDREAQQAVYANRRRITGTRGKALLRRRGEFVERPFEHALNAGGMRRTHLRSHAKILKRLLIHCAGLNLALLMRTMFGRGTPKQLAEELSGALSALFKALHRLLERVGDVIDKKTLRFNHSVGIHAGFSTPSTAPLHCECWSFSPAC